MTDEEKVADFARAQLARYSAYHAHKESMAYVGLALFAGVAGTILVSDKWPPAAWGGDGKALASFALSFAWAVMLVYLRFQLHRRRWAALRMAACERVLAMWATGQLADPNDLAAANRQSSAEVKWYIRFVDFVVWPLRRTVKAVQGPQNVPEKPRPIYPRVFVSALEFVEKSGTDAIYHERLMHITGWGLYVATIVRTKGDLILSIADYLRLLEILVWPGVAVCAILVVRPYLTTLLSGAKIKFTVAGQSLETTLPELRQILEEQSGEPLLPTHIQYLNELRNAGAKRYPNGVESSDERRFLRPLRNAGLILTVPRNAFLSEATVIELSALGRLYLRAQGEGATRST